MIPGSPSTASLRRLLTELGESGRTGALHVGGSPGGVLFLIAGRIAYAESPAVPGIGERLVASGRLPAAVWQAAYDAGRGTHAVGRLLVRDGYVGQNELACRVVAAISDATHALLCGEVGLIGFVPGRRHWLGVVTQVELGALGHETARRMLTVPVPRSGDRRPRTRRTRQDAHGVRHPIGRRPQDGPR